MDREVGGYGGKEANVGHTIHDTITVIVDYGKKCVDVRFQLL